MTNYSEHFTELELQDPYTKEIKLTPLFIDNLEILREVYARPMSLTSACRSLQQNTWLQSRGYAASTNSLHLMDNKKYNTQCCAVDLKRPNDRDLANLVFQALNLGWSVRIANNFIHLDLRTRYTDLPQVVGTYN